MIPIYKEASFPADYRETEIRQIMDALYRLRSIAITGLAGMGKSNVVRYVVSHPQVRPRYLGQRADDWAFVHVDCAGVAGSDEAELLSEIAFQLCDTQTLVSLDHSVHHRRALKTLILDLDPALNLALVFDYFDQAATKLDQSFFNFLFHLRNTRPRGNLAYVFATRRPMKRLYELQELLDDDCVIGPLGARDALASIRRDEARLGHTFSSTQRERLIACTGGHPGFMKNACELLGSDQVDACSSAEEFARQMLRFPKMKNLCAELWQDLTDAEQHILTTVAGGIPLLHCRDGAGVAFLKQYGLLAGAKPDLAIFCPLFSAFVRAQASDSDAVRITAVFPNQAHLETAAGAKRTTLSPKLFSLLRALAATPGQVISTEELIAQVYGDEAPGVTNAALSQLVKRLRSALDPHVQEMSGDSSCTCVETIREVGYKLLHNIPAASNA